MIPNKRPASEYRVRTLDRNDLNEKGKIYIGKGGTTTVDGVAGVSDITAKNIIDAINDNSNGREISAKSFTANDTITSDGKITAKTYIHADSYIYAGSYITSEAYIRAKSNIISRGSIMVTDNNGTPLAKMDSAGNISANGNITSSSSIQVIDDDGTPLAKIDSFGNIFAQSFDARSDKRLKENIVEYSPNKSILDLPIYSYNFISDEKKTKKIGCLAQDLQKICPEIVHEGTDGFLSIEENKLVYLLLEEVKKLKKRVDELEAR